MVGSEMPGVLYQMEVREVYADKPDEGDEKQTATPLAASVSECYSQSRCE